ncbi:MAG: hypothetical protein HFJ06_15620 [Lachnospiraceae bacterium]|nr:hypothetical protein [Lachnospiraceae bacterium]
MHTLKEKQTGKVVMMDISINKVKMVIDELQAAEMTYKRQLDAFERIVYEYRSMEKEGNDKRTLKKISDDLNSEYQSMKKLRKVLSEVVREYDNTEKAIIKNISNTSGSSPVFKRIDIEKTQAILRKFHINII